MSREIKFRAWSAEESKMYEFDLAQYMATNEGGQEDLCPSGISQTLMQFTGLKDKNGKEIYESDLLKDCLTGAILEVKFGFNKRRGYNGWYCSFCQLEMDDTYLNADYDTDVNINVQIIGNIYENPDLIKRKRQSEPA